MGQVTTGATTHYPNLLPAALMNAGYAVNANMPGSLGGGAANSASSGYVLRMRNLPPGTAKYDIVKVLRSPASLQLLCFTFRGLGMHRLHPRIRACMLY